MVKGLYNPKLKLPRIPCSDGAGEVAAVGEGVTAWKPGDRVAGIFMQNWLDGPLTPAKARGALGGDIDGMLAEYVVLKETGLVAPARASQLSGGRHAALRRRHRLERAGRRQSEAGSHGADPGNRRRLHLCPAICPAARRARAGHLQQLREAGARLLPGPRRRPQLPRKPRLGPLGAGRNRRRGRGPGGRSGRPGHAAPLPARHPHGRRHRPGRRALRPRR